MASPDQPGGRDPWAAAKERQRREVAALFERQHWTCGNCGATNPTSRTDCAQCGRPRVARAKRFERGPRPWLLAGAGLLVLGVLAVLIVPGLRDDAAEEREAEAARVAALAEAERRRQITEMAPKRAAGPQRRSDEDGIAHRQRLLARAERLVTADSRARVAAGAMEGPVAGTQCEPYPESETRARAELDPSVTVARYHCIAYSRKIELSEVEGQQRVGLSGHPYYVVLDYLAARITWCRLIPRVAEGGKTLAAVPLPMPCRDPEGPG